MTRRTYLALLISTALLAGGFVSAATLTSSSEATWRTPLGFVELLIARNIISSEHAERARAFARMFSDTSPNDGVGTPRTMHDADKVRVSVSQLIQHANSEYVEGDDVEGLLLLVENTTDIEAVLEAKRKCQVVYRIFSDDALVYDSATSKRCMTDERVSYVLGAGKTRMFEVTHASTTHSLPAGSYRFELEYPGYGGGEKSVTILKR